LYLLGGGWDVLTVNSGFPLDQRCAVALAIKVPWNETNRKHTFEVEVSAEDPVTEQPKSLLKAGGQFEVGRPPGIPLGQDQRVQIALEANLRIEAPGAKLIVVRVEGEEMKRTSFNVVAGPLLTQRPKKPGEP
ncbi:MAG: hypothetical protein HY686_04845, partial [Chloroflexi bacterium]|nr:hypothetical protein [Chloroflexota bacterium]